MDNVVRFPVRHHARIPSVSDLRKASIGTSPPETSLKRLAKLKEASLRPAKRLRKCDSEQSAATARSLIDLSFASAQRSIGCGSDMGADISPRNEESQPKIFLPEIPLPISGLLQSDMGKRRKSEPREIFLGDWLKEWQIGPTEAAKIAGCTQSYITNISSGVRSNVNVLYLLRLSEEMGINVNDFFRPIPSQAQLAPLKNLSPRAQAAILSRSQKKA